MKERKDVIWEWKTRHEIGTNFVPRVYVCVCILGYGVMPYKLHRHALRNHSSFRFNI